MMHANTDTLRVISARIANRVQESSRIISLELVAEDGTELPPFAAGAHIDVRINDTLVRQYSLLNNPSERHRYRIGVLLELESRGGSEAIHRDFAVGQRVEISEPRNHFSLETVGEDNLLLAGGVGITPIMSMAQQLHQDGRDFALHYCVRTGADAAFASELLQMPFGDRVHIHADDGEPEQKFDARTLLAQIHPDRHVYICGPGGFIDHVVKTAAFAGWEAHQIHLERFTAAPLLNEAFTVVAARSGIEVTVCAGQRISEALRAAGVEVEMSCEAGVCGTCYTTVLEGIPDHKDTFQTPAEHASNEGIAICCSGSRSPKLVLDI